LVQLFVRSFVSVAATVCLVALSGCADNTLRVHRDASPDACALPDGAADGADADADGGDLADRADDDRGESADGDSGSGSDGDGGDQSETPPPTCAQCAVYGISVPVGNEPSVLTELSGLAASHVHPGTLYTHNDSGDLARFFAISDKAVLNADIRLTGVSATDWEAISVGPCPSGSCVYVGDIGDNDHNRAGCTIYRVVEPATLPSDGSIVSVSSERFPFVYPDGPHNAETLLVHPTTGQVFVIIKEAGISAAVYEMPLPLVADQQVTLTWVTALSMPAADGLVTDGSFHPCGDRLLIRTTGTAGLHELARAPGQDLLALFSGKPVAVAVAPELQGEAVTYALDGLRYFTASEVVAGYPAPTLNLVGCSAPQ
jgi:hypothetical protein